MTGEFSEKGNRPIHKTPDCGSYEYLSIRYWPDVKSTNINKHTIKQFKNLKMNPKFGTNTYNHYKKQQFL